MKKTARLVMIFFLLFLSPAAGTGAVTLHSHWELFPQFIGGRVWTSTELKPGLDLTMGYLVEGEQHAPEKLHTDLDPFYFKAETDTGVFTFGKFSPKWGYGPFDSLMLSGFAPGMVGVKWADSFYGLDYERFSFWISGERGKLYGHRLEIPVLPGVRLGVKEVALYAKNFDSMWLCYVPFWPFYFNKYIPSVENTKDDNNNIGLDLTVDVNKIIFYGDLHVAEFPLGPEKTNLPIYGAKAGLYFKELFWDALSLKVEYIRTTNYLYSRSEDSAQTAYEYRGRPLGSPLDQDAERLALLAGYRVHDDLVLYLGYRREHKGEGTLGDYYDSLEEGRKNLFLSGVVEKRNIPVGGFWYRVSPGLEIELTAEIQFLENADHQKGEKGTRTTGYLTLSWQF